MRLYSGSDPGFENYQIKRLYRFIIWAVAICVMVLISWSYWAKVDLLVRGEGKLVPSGQVKMIQSLEGGLITQINVIEGDHVALGQLLVRLDDTQFSASHNEKQATLSAINMRIERLQSELSGTPFLMDKSWESSERYEQEKSLLDARQQSLKAATEVLDKQLEQQAAVIVQVQSQREQNEAEFTLAEKELNLLKPLFEQGVVSQVDLLRAEKEWVRTQGEVKRSLSKITQTQALISELMQKKEERLSSFIEDTERELNQALSEKASLQEVLAGWADKIDRTEVRAPVAGIVQRVFVNTVGGVVSPGMPILSIVPGNDRLVVEARVKPSDIAYVRPGQAVRIRLSAYDFTRYGSLSGELVHISADAIQDEQGGTYYLVRAETESTIRDPNGEVLPLLPGMVVELDIVTGKRSILDYLVKPILRAQQIALREQ